MFFHTGLAPLVEHGGKAPGCFLTQKVLDELGLFEADGAGKALGFDADFAVMGDVDDDLF